MKKLLIMAPLFYPQKKGGGPTVSVMNLVKCIKDKFELYVISNNYENGESSPLDGVDSGWNSYDFGKVYYFDYGQNTIKNIYKLICEIKPDVIYQNSFFSYRTALATLFYNKYHDVKAIVAPRGELCKNAYALKTLKKSIYFNGTKLLGLHRKLYIHATGDDELDSIKQFIKKEDKYFYNISNITMVDSDEFIPIQKEPGNLRVVFVARIHRIKNLLKVIENLKFAKGNVVFDIYGPIEDEEYWDECKKQIKELPLNIKASYCGQLNQEEVSKKIKEYHIFYMPSSSENHGHSIVEALMSYRPVIISNNTPWKNLDYYECGYSLHLDDNKGFLDAVQTYIDMDITSFEKQCKKAREYIVNELNVDKVKEKYILMLNE